MEQIGRYRILEELGRGAMGVVYNALDPEIGRTIAIKSIPLVELTDVSERQRVRDRLLREAQSAGILSHPNIVTIYDILEQQDMAYIFMEYVNGPSLEKMMRAGTLPGRRLWSNCFGKPLVRSIMPIRKASSIVTSSQRTIGRRNWFGPGSNGQDHRLRSRQVRIAGIDS